MTDKIEDNIIEDSTTADSITDLIDRLGAQLVKEELMLATAESCTGGWIAKAVTDKAGSSAFFDFSCVTYSNDAKQKLLGVSAQTLADHGAVSEPVVVEMAEGLLGICNASVGVATSGIAGPGGGTADKPVGTVCFAWAFKNKPTHKVTKQFSGDRESIRKQAVKYALEGILHNLLS